MFSDKLDRLVARDLDRRRKFSASVDMTMAPRNLVPKTNLISLCMAWEELARQSSKSEEVKCLRSCVKELRGVMAVSAGL